MDKEEYRNHRDTKNRWYEKFFPGCLIETMESPTLSTDADGLIRRHFGGR
jgi:hypothetical protein